MGLLQIRFEDETSSATIYSTWDDDETPDAVVNLACMQDIFRAQEGAPFEHPGWLRALEICHAVQSEMPEAAIEQRYAAALERFLRTGSTTAGNATSLASLMVSFDAHYFRAYPDDRSFANEGHGIDSAPHVIVKIANVDNGHGPEIVLSIIPHPGVQCFFIDDEDTWELDLRHCIKSLSPFAPDLIEVAQEPGQVPVVTARFDAVTVATAFARVLGFPLPNSIPLHGPIEDRRGSWSPESGTRVVSAIGEGHLVVRFHSPAGPFADCPEETVTLKRKGDVRDLPGVLARLASLPLLPMLLQGTDDRVSLPYRSMARQCRKEDMIASRFGKRPEDSDLAIRVRQVERWAMGFAVPNFRRALAGYASFVFTAEPGLWEMFQDEAVMPTQGDINVNVELLYPENMVGSVIVHSSSDPEPTADDPDSTHVTARMTIAPHPSHLDELRENQEFARHCSVLDGWRAAFAPYRMRTLGYDPENCSLTAYFEQTFFASAHAWVAGLPLPAETPFGIRPELPAFSYKATLPRTMKAC